MSGNGQAKPPDLNQDIARAKQQAFLEELEALEDKHDIKILAALQTGMFGITPTFSLVNKKQFEESLKHQKGE